MRNTLSFGILSVIICLIVEISLTWAFAEEIIYRAPETGVPAAQIGIGTRGPARGPARGLSRGPARGLLNYEDNTLKPCRSVASGARGPARGVSRGLSRGEADEPQEIKLAVLGPGHQGGRTSQVQPVLYWGLVNACDYDKLELILREFTDDAFGHFPETFIEIILPGPADGIHPLKLADYDVTLIPSKKYELLLRLMLDENNPSLDITAQTAFEYVEGGDELVQAINGQEGVELAKIYALKSWWYDSVETLFSDPALRDLRINLLRQANLPTEIVSLDIVDE
jgi:hypothetical protein